MNHSGLRLCTIGLSCAIGLSACGGSAGGTLDNSDAGAIATDESTPLDDPLLDAENVQQDAPLACAAEFDVAELFLTEVDRQWSCQITSNVGIRFDDLFFDRNGTAVSANDGIRYWNRNLPDATVNLLSPTQPSMLMSEIGASNTVLMFNTVTPSGVEQSYDCVLVPREVSS